MTVLSELRGAKLQRIDAPSRTVFVLTFHRHDLRGALVIWLRPQGARWGWVDRRPRGEPASAFVRQLRKHLENARVITVELDAEGARIELARGDARPCICVDARPSNLRLELDGSTLGRANAGGRPAPGSERGSATGLVADWDTLVRDGPALVEAAMGEAPDARRRELLKAARRQTAKLRRRLRKIEADLDRVDEVGGLRARADLLLAHLHEIPSGAVEAVVTDWNTGQPLTIELRKGRTPREEADALYSRARKLERGGRMALERHDLTTREIETLERLAERLTVAAAEELEPIADALHRAGVPRGKQGPPGARPARSGFRTFEGDGERAIYVGRSAKDNDALTQSARPNDLWLHARGVRGSHVVVPLRKRETCPPALLLDAAHLAAHFSAAKGEAIVDVQYCPRRHVRKPKGIAVGAVLVEREKVLVLRIEPDRLARLLGRAKP